jgi:hypothetical protein
MTWLHNFFNIQRRTPIYTSLMSINVKQSEMYLFPWVRRLLRGPPSWHPSLNPWETWVVPVGPPAHQGRQARSRFEWSAVLYGPSCIPPHSSVMQQVLLVELAVEDG